MSRKAICILIVLAMALFAACSSSYEELGMKRAARAQKAKGDIRVAVVWDNQRVEGLFKEGIELAVERINQKGGVLGRKVRIVSWETGSDEEELRVARKIARDADIVAVIGHGLSDRAIPASVIYEKSRVIFISPGATSPRLTGHSFRYVFRNIPSDRETARHLARFAKSLGYMKVAVISDESEYGQVLADSFMEHAQKIGIEVCLVRSYYCWQEDFKAMLADIKSAEPDAVFIGGMLPLAGEVILQAREMALKMPFLGGDGLDREKILSLEGHAADNVIISTVFNPESPDADLQAFRRDFYERFKKSPDIWAAQGYDAMNLLCSAFEGARSTVPSLVSSHLHFLTNKQGVNGFYSFNQDGDIKDKRTYFKKVWKGKFQMLDDPGARPPEIISPEPFNDAVPQIQVSDR